MYASSQAPIVVALSAVLGLGWMPAAAAGPRKRAPARSTVVDAPEDVRASDLTRQGEAARERGDDAAAARAYEAAYEAMPNAQRLGAAGAFVVGNAARAYRDASAASRALQELKAARAMLLRFGEERRAAGTPIPAFVEAELGDLDREIVAAAPTPEPEPPPPEPPKPPPPPPPAVRPAPHIKLAPTPPAVDHRLLRRRNTGTALLVAGGLVAGAGAVLLGVGTTIAPSAARDRDEGRASSQYDAADPQMRANYDAAIDRYVYDSRGAGRGLIGGGGATISVGIASLVVGAVLLARARRQRAATPMRPYAHRSRSLVSVQPRRAMR